MAWVKKASIKEYYNYMKRVQAFLSQPRGRKALLYGGIVWRIAMECLGNDALELALQGPSDDVYQYGIRYIDDKDGRCCDDGLSVAELDMICGVYEVDTGRKYNIQHTIQYIIANK